MHEIPGDIQLETVFAPESSQLLADRRMLAVATAFVQEGGTNATGDDMTTTTGAGIPARAELVDRAKALQPLLARHAGHGDVNRRLCDEAIDGLAGAGLFRLTTPRRYGGYAASLRTLVDVTEMLAVADASAAWLVAVAAAGNWGAAHATGRAQREIYGANPDVRVVSSGAQGTGRRVAGGIRVSGRWPYASGAPHADWARVVVRVGDGGPVDLYVALVPKSDIGIEDTWRTVGMRATGSQTLLGDNLFVPDYRLVTSGDLEKAPSLHDELFFRVPPTALAAVTLLGTVLGLGRAALQHAIQPAPMKETHQELFTGQSTSVAVQVQIAEAALKIDTARLHAHRAAEAFDAAAGDPAVLDDVERARMRASSGHAAKLVLDAIQMLLDVRGAGSFAENSPLQRIWRDANVGCRHAALKAAIVNEAFGKALLGALE